MTHAGPRFTSSKCPAGPGLENTCELPFGLVWTPLLSEDDSTAMPAAAVTEEPILCLTCLAYFNLYAQIRQQENQWICPWCGAENVLPQKNAESLLQPYMSQSVLEIQQPLKEPFKKDVTNWILCLDEHLPCLEVQAIGQTVSNLLLESESTIHLGLLIFGKHVTIYHVGSAKSKLVSAQVVASHTDFVTGNEDDEDEPSEVDPQYYQTMSTAQDVQHLWHCLAAHYQITIPDETTKEQQTPNTPKSRLEILKLRKQKRLAAAKNEGKSGASSSGWTLTKPNPIMRATGHALQCAVELAARPVQPAARTARILLVTNGCPNYGPASVVDDDSSSSKNNQHVDPYKLAIAQEYLDTLGQTAVAAGIGIDVLCTGSLELAMPAYQSLVQASSGYALAQDSVQELKRNLQFLWKETALSGQYTESAHPQDWVDGCLVDLRMSRYVCVNACV